MLSRSGSDWVSQTGGSSGRSKHFPQRRGEEKHDAAVSAWSHCHNKEAEIKQEMKKNREI